jgi:hypothetical protein
MGHPHLQYCRSTLLANYFPYVLLIFRCGGEKQEVPKITDTINWCGSYSLQTSIIRPNNNAALSAELIRHLMDRDDHLELWVCKSLQHSSHDLLFNNFPVSDKLRTVNSLYTYCDMKRVQFNRRSHSLLGKGCTKGI